MRRRGFSLAWLYVEEQRNEFSSETEAYAEAVRISVRIGSWVEVVAPDGTKVFVNVSKK